MLKDMTLVKLMVSVNKMAFLVSISRV